MSNVWSDGPGIIDLDTSVVAALIDTQLFERIRRLQARLDGLCDRLEAAVATSRARHWMMPSLGVLRGLRHRRAHGA